MPTCNCASYPDLEPNRKSIDRRIRQTRAIKKTLQVVAEQPHRVNTLYKCQECGQFWQGNWAWNWGGKEYLFKVPDIWDAGWLAEPYAQPDLLLIYIASMDRFLNQNDFQEST